MPGDSYHITVPGWTPQLIADQRWLHETFSCSLCGKGLVMWRQVAPGESEVHVRDRLTALIAAKKETVDGRCHHV